MSTALICLAALLATADAAEKGETPSELDQLLENVAPLLDAPGAYHTEPAAGEGPEPLALDLARCVQMALEQNAEILVAETDVAVRESLAGQARSRRLPEVQARIGYSYIDGLDQEIGRPGIRKLIGAEGYAPEKATVTTNLSITQILFAGGQIQAAVKASRFLARSEAWRRDAVRSEVAFQARSAYHDALLAHALVTVAEEALAVFERHLKNTESLHEEGVVTPFEVHRAQSEVGERRADLASAEAGARLADLNMRRLLALPDGQPLTYDRQLPRETVEATADTLKAHARAQRPGLKALQEAVAAGQQQVAGVKGKYLPQASATVSWTNVENGGRVLPDGWQVNVGAQWDLYLGGQRKHELAETRSRLEGLRIEQADLERLVVLDVEQALIRLREAMVAMRTDRENVAVAAESVRLAKLRYQEGYGTQTEIIDSALAHTRAQTALVQAVRDYYVAYASLQRALGTDPATVPAADEAADAPKESRQLGAQAARLHDGAEGAKKRP